MLYCKSSQNGAIKASVFKKFSKIQEFRPVPSPGEILEAVRSYSSTLLVVGNRIQRRVPLAGPNIYEDEDRYDNNRNLIPDPTGESDSGNDETQQAFVDIRRPGILDDSDASSDGDNEIAAIIKRKALKRLKVQPHVPVPSDRVTKAMVRKEFEKPDNVS